MRDILLRLGEDWRRCGAGFQQFLMGSLAGLFFSAIVALWAFA